jgi:hypothetical protein
MCKAGKEKSGQVNGTKAEGTSGDTYCCIVSGFAQFSCNDDFTIAFLTPLF